MGRPDESTEVAAAVVSDEFPRLAPPQQTQELRVANTTNVQQLATSIYKNLQEGKRVYLTCIGVQSIGQAVKATAIVNGISGPQGWYISTANSFMETEEVDRNTGLVTKKTVIKLTVLRHEFK